MSEFFLNVVNMSISASWIVLVVLLLRLLLKKAPKWITVLLWGIVAVRLICPFTIESIMSLIPSAETISPEIMMDRTPEINSGVPIINNVVNPVISKSFAPDPATSANPLQLWIPTFAVMWIVGIIGMLLYTVISYFKLKRKIGTAVLLRDNIFQSESVVSPFVLGIIKPKIYLPFAIDGQNMEHVIAHEQAHVKRKDHWWKPLGFLILTIHWFNPLVWIGYVLLCRDIELACDEKVVKDFNNEQKADYSQALLTCSVNRRMIAACPLAFGEVGVKGRVKSVLNYKKPAFWIILIAIVVSVVVAVCFLTNPASNTLENIEFLNFAARRENTVSVLVSDGETYTSVGGVSEDLLNELCNVKISRNEISRNRSEDRDKTHTLVLQTAKDTEPTTNSYVEGWQIHFNSTFTSVWVNNNVKPTLSYKVINPLKAKQVYEDIANYIGAEKLTWTYSPMLSYTGHRFFPFELDFDYSYVIATCDNGKMKNLKADGQREDTTLRFEKGQPVYWTPDESVIEKVSETSKVEFAVYDDDNEIYSATVVFECVARELSSADFEIHLEKSNGLILTRKDGDVCFVENNSSISTVGGVDAINNTNPYLPKLYVSYGDLKVSAWTGTASWTFTNDNGTAQTINGDSSGPLAMVDYIKPWAINIPNRKGNPILELNFDVVPDSIESNGWYFAENGKTKSFDPTIEGMTIMLNDFSEPCLYEVVATWDSSEEYFGTIHYAFYVSSNSVTVMSVKEIVDRTETEGIPTDQAEQPFFIDENYIYYFPSMRSEYVIVTFDNGDKMTVQHALGQGLLSISHLDKWNITYNKKENNGEFELDENGNVVWVTSYPQDLYHSTLGHFQTLYEETPTEQIQGKYDNEEFVITKMHYYNTEEKWCANGHSYLYRLEITGRRNNDEKNTTYIVLSNNKNITFAQTWKASGLSSLSTDYFKPEEATIVGYKLFS